MRWRPVRAEIHRDHRVARRDTEPSRAHPTPTPSRRPTPTPEPTPKPTADAAAPSLPDATADGDSQTRPVADAIAMPPDARPLGSTGTERSPVDPVGIAHRDGHAPARVRIRDSDALR